ncbi:MAG: PD40 domain-containing protein, partial [Acidobacteria bacterium]|nr:PD40 domain-containing protein [Acidobacteriota bacterium]
YRSWILDVIVIAAFGLVLGIGGWYGSRARERVPPTITRLTTHGLVDRSAISPDGKLYAYTKMDTGRGESVWLGHVDGGPEIMLRPTDPGDYGKLQFSPDGSRLYMVWVPGTSSDHGILFRMPVFGGPVEKVKDDVFGGPTFSPDGKQYAFVRFTADSLRNSLIIANTDDGVERELLSRSDPQKIVANSIAWSPDGGEIAFAGGKEGGRTQEIFSTRVADGEVRQVTNFNWETVYTQTWTRDGRLFADASEMGANLKRQVWTVDPATGKVERLISDLNTYYTLSASNDVSELLTTQAQRYSNIWVGPSADFSSARQITADMFGKQTGWDGLDFASDGRIFFTGYVGLSETLWVMREDGSEQRQVLPEARTNYHLSLPDNGAFVVFESNRSGQTEVWRMSPDGGELAQLTSDGPNENPHVSPDGSRIVYTSTRDGQKGLWVQDVASGAQRRLTEFTGDWARFSPDGSMIACSYDGTELGKLAIVSSDSGQLIKLFETPRTANFRLSFRWTPDSKAVTYRDWNDGIWKQDLAGGEPTRLPGLPHEKLLAYAWSHDGKQFAFTRYLDIHDLVLIKGFE